MQQKIDAALAAENSSQGKGILGRGSNPRPFAQKADTLPLIDLLRAVVPI